MKVPRILLVGAAVPVLAFSLIACSSDEGASPESGYVAGAAFIDGAGLHGIDESINEKKEVPATARTAALKTAAVIRNTTWPSDQKAAAKSLGDTLEALAAELDKDNPDLARAGELAMKAHDDAHDFTAEIWNHLYESADLPVADHAH